MAGRGCLRKIIKIVATRCYILKLRCTKCNFGWGSAPTPLGSLQLAGFEEPNSKGKEGNRRGDIGEGGEWGRRSPTYYFGRKLHCIGTQLHTLRNRRHTKDTADIVQVSRKTVNKGSFKKVNFCTVSFEK